MSSWAHFLTRKLDSNFVSKNKNLIFREKMLSICTWFTLILKFIFISFVIAQYVENYNYQNQVWHLLYSMSLTATLCGVTPITSAWTSFDGTSRLIILCWIAFVGDFIFVAMKVKYFFPTTYAGLPLMQLTKTLIFICFSLLLVESPFYLVWPLFLSHISFQNSFGWPACSVDLSCINAESIILTPSHFSLTKYMQIFDE